MTEQDINQSSGQQTKPKSNKSWMIVAITFVLISIGLGSYGFITIRNLNNKINSLNSQVSDLQNKKKTLEDAAAAAASAAVKATVAVNTTTSKTDQDKIVSALRSQCSEKYVNSENGSTIGADLQVYNIKSINGNYAQASYVCKGANEGPEVILVKTNDNWNVVASGIGPFVEDAVRNLYSIPANLPQY
jgi:hypothetical protein